MRDFVVRDAPFDVLLLHNTANYSPTKGNVAYHCATNLAGDAFAFTTRHHDRAATRRVSRAQVFYLRRDAHYTPRRIHGGGDGDFNAKAALIRLPQSSTIWNTPVERFERRWFFETIKAPLVYHRYHEHHQTTTGYRAPPPEDIADAIEHHYGIGSVAHPTEAAKAMLEGEVFLRKLGLKHERIVYTASSNLEGVEHEHEILRRT